jgi:hypothetical protein
VPRKTESGKAYQIKVTLLGTRPPIWRRLLVPADLTLEQLHPILQTAMGWTNSHLHEFRHGQTTYGRRDPWLDDFGMNDVRSEGSVRLSSVLGRAGAKIKYTYDFGDGWEHQIVVEKTLPIDPEDTYPRCLGGRRQCPPEDCGGIGGFYDLLGKLSDPNHEEYEEMLEWIGGGFDPDAFSVDDVNEALRPRKPRAARA